MRLIITQNDRGIALLLAVAVTALVVTVSLEIHRKVRSAVAVTATSRDRISLNHMAASGIHAAMALLVRDKMISQTDSIQEDWADPEKIAELIQEIPFEEGKLEVKIEDEMSKLQVNALVIHPDGLSFNEPQRIVWDRFLNSYVSKHDVFEEMEPSTIIDALKDWLDSGDDDAITGLNGAEFDYYEDQEIPYFCRNGPVKYKAELMRLKGMSMELYEGIEDIAGISEFITVYGASSQQSTTTMQWDGKVNISTAALPVIAALLPPEAADLADVIIEYREEKDGDTFVNDLSSLTWYKSVPGLSDININADLITVRSDVFRITAVASLHDSQSSATAIVYREQLKKTGKFICRVLSWKGE